MLYRLLGVGAKIADQTVLFFILLFVWFPPLYWAGKLLHEDDLTYDQTTVSNLAKGWQAPPDHHLLITGTLRTDLALQTKWAKGHNINGETFVPLLDGNGQNVLLVEYSSRSDVPQSNSTVTVAGALVGVQGDLSDVMPADGPLLYNRRQYLISDESLHIQRHVDAPTLVDRGLAYLCRLLTLLLLSLSGLALLAALKRKVIFQTQGLTAKASSCSVFAVGVSAPLALPLDETSSTLATMLARAIRNQQRPFHSQYFLTFLERPTFCRTTPLK
ncbi:MAG: hypothetical protein U0931_13475 [Vulcanimicrobiota bacterium]